MANKFKRIIIEIRNLFNREFINSIGKGMIYGNLVISNGGGVRIESAI